MFPVWLSVAARLKVHHASCFTSCEAVGLIGFSDSFLDCLEDIRGFFLLFFHLWDRFQPAVGFPTLLLNARVPLSMILNSLKTRGVK